MIRIAYEMNLWLCNMSLLPFISFRDKLEHYLLAQLTMCCQQQLTFYALHRPLVGQRILLRLHSVVICVSQQGGVFQMCCFQSVPETE